MFILRGTNLVKIWWVLIWGTYYLLKSGRLKYVPVKLKIFRISQILQICIFVL